MLWRNRPQIFFTEQHAREPGGMERVQVNLYCQHYGKSLSVEHWEETCDYYIRHFPFDTYGRKWLDRKSRAIHIQSDFMRPLYEWDTAAVGLWRSGSPALGGTQISSVRILCNGSRNARQLGLLYLSYPM